jgi:hypothetical protein
MKTLEVHLGCFRFQPAITRSLRHPLVYVVENVSEPLFGWISTRAQGVQNATIHYITLVVNVHNWL